MLSEMDMLCKKNMRNDVSSWIFAFRSFPAKYFQGYSPRLCLWVYLEMISTGHPFTARHVPQNLLTPWVYF